MRGISDQCLVYFLRFHTKKMSDGDSCQSIGEVIFTDKPGLYFVIFAFVVRFPLEGEVRRIAGDVSVDVQPVLTAVGNLVESVGYLFK